MARCTCFPGIVARGNYSRIGIARVLFNEDGDPAGVERLGIALEPEADYELRPDGGGCEDPRITFFEPFQQYIMTYTAFSSQGPGSPWRCRATCSGGSGWGWRPSARMKASSLRAWTTRMPASSPWRSTIHPGSRRWPCCTGRSFPGLARRKRRADPASRTADLHRESIWISYCPMAIEGHEPDHFGHFASHHRLASPVSPWEQLKIGVGTPPVLTRHGWLIVYHGVSEVGEHRTAKATICATRPG